MPQNKASGFLVPNYCLGRGNYTNEKELRGIQQSKDWWLGLKKRHPELTIRRSEKLSSSRPRMMNPVVVDKYYTDLEQIVNDSNLENKPHCIWNTDETGRSFDHTPVRVISYKKN